MSTLKKKDVEELLERYDTHPHDALLTCLRKLLGNPLLTWHDAIKQLPDRWNQHALISGNIDALDELVKYLVENRTLQQL